MQTPLLMFIMLTSFLSFLIPMELHASPQCTKALAGTESLHELAKDPEVPWLDLLEALQVPYEDGLAYFYAQKKFAMILGSETAPLPVDLDPTYFLSQAADIQTGFFFRGLRLNIQDLIKSLEVGFLGPFDVVKDFSVAAHSSFHHQTLHLADSQEVPKDLIVIFEFQPNIPTERRNSTLYRAQKIDPHAINEVFVFNPYFYRFIPLSKILKSTSEETHPPFQ